jgi:hypothetical protein
MDVLEQFLYSISYKFSKGYPDINNPKDFLLIKEELKKINIDLDELNLTKHYNDRKKERSVILDVPNLTQQMIGDNDIQTVKDQIISQTQNEISKRLTQLENIKNLPLSFREIIVYKIIKPVLSFQGKKYDLLLTTESEVNNVKKLYNDKYYYAVVEEDDIITLMGGVGDDSEIEEKTLNHLKQKNKPIKPVKILTLSDYEYIIQLDKSVLQNITFTPNELPYKVKTIYRPGTNFTHNKFGTGIITAASSYGNPDSRGIVDWIEVKYDNPYVTGGQLKDTRRFEKLYTLISPSIDKVTAE